MKFRLIPAGLPLRGALTKMAYLEGLTQGGVQVMSVGGPVADSGSRGNQVPPQVAANTVVIDGTPVRVVVLALAAAAGLTALKWGGFRFNVGVST